MSLNGVKRRLKRALKGPVLDTIQAVRTKFRARPAEMVALEAEHRRASAELPADVFRFRSGMHARIDPRSRDAFEWFCFRSPNMVQEFDHFVSVARDKRAFLDVGSSHGVFSLGFTIGRPGVTAVAVDASPIAYEVLSENARLNPDLDIACVNVAAGAAPGRLVMRRFWHHLEAVPEGQEKPDDVTVAVRPIDDILAERGYSPDLIKIDVEGYELYALQGLKKYLGRNPVDLFLEIHPDMIEALGYRVADIVALLRELGYSFFAADRTGRPMSPAEVSDSLHTTWILCRTSA